MLIDTTEMSFADPAPEPMNPYSESTAAQAAADAVSYTGNKDLYWTVKAELMGSGKSPTYDQIRQQAQKEAQNRAIKDTARILRENADNKLAAKQRLLLAEDASLEEEALRKQNAEYVPDLRDYTAFKDAQEFVQTYEQSKSEVTQEIVSLMEELQGGSSTAGLLGKGLVAALIPANDLVFTGRVVNKATGKTSVKNFSFGAPNELRETFNALPSTEAKLEFLEDVAEAFNSTKALLGLDDAQKLAILSDMTQDYLNGAELDDRALQKNANLLFTAAEFLGLGAAIKGTAASLKGLRTSTKLDNLSNANPVKGREATNSILQSDETAEAMGTTRGDAAIDMVMPKWRGTDGEPVNMNGAPAGVLRSIEINQSYGEAALDALKSQGFIAADQTRNAIQKRTLEHLRANTDMHLSESDSVLQYGDDGINTLAVFQRTPDSGFDTREAALEAAREAFPEATLTVMRPKNSSGYRVGVDHFRPYDDVFVEMSFSDKAVWYSSRIADYLLDPVSRYSQEISRVFSRAHDLEQGTQARLNSILSDYKKLRNNERGMVLQLADEGMSGKPGETTGFVYSPMELRAKLSHLPEKRQEKVMKGYYSFRTLADTLYVATNRRFRKDMLRKGYNKTIDLGDGTRMPVRNIREGDGTAYDPALGAVREVDEGELIADAFDDVSTGNSLHKRVIVHSADDLPEEVLKYDPGYVPTKYSETYMVKRTGLRKVVDGNKTDYDQAVAAAPTLADANKLAKKLKAERAASIARLESALEGATEAEKATIKSNIAELKRQDYDVVYERSVDPNERLRLETDIEAAKGRMMFSKKGQRLQGITAGGLASIDDPFNAMRRAIAATARYGAWEQALQSMKYRFMNTYGDLVQTQKGYPTSVQAIQGGPNDQARVAQAKSLWRHINNIETPTGGEVTQAWQRMWLSFSEALPGGYASRVAANLSRTDPLSKVRAYNFITMLALNPARQVFLQTQQFLALSGVAPTYVLSPAIVRDYMGLVAGFAAKGTKGAKEVAPYTIDQLAPGAARAMGMSVQEYKNTVRAFRESGLVSGIDSHMLSQDAVAQLSEEFQRSVAGNVAQKFTNFAKQVLNVPRVAGFNFGEFNNLVATWLVARKQYLKKNPNADMKSRKVIDDIAINARQMALDMTPVGQFAHQQGFLSLMTQFLSFQQKMLLAMSPFKVGNQVFTQAERARIAAGQLLLFGATGLGLREAWNALKEETGLDVPPEVDDVIAYGAYEAVFNATLSAVTGDDVDIAISANVAPGGGVVDSLGGIVSDIFSGDRTAFEILMGPSQASSDRISNTIKTMHYLTADPNLDTVDKFVRGINAVAENASGLSNYAKYKIAQNIGASVEKFSDPIAHQSATEARLKLLGLSTHAEEEYWETLMDLSKQERAIRDDAKWLYETFKRDVARYQLAGGSGVGERNERIIQEADNLFALVYSLYPKEKASEIQEVIQGLMLNEKNEFGRTEVHRLIMEKLSSGELGADPNRYFEQLEEGDVLNEQQIEHLKKTREQFYEAREQFYTGEE